MTLLVFADNSTDLPPATETAAATFLAAPNLPLAVDLLDDGLLLVRVGIEVAGHHLVVDAEVTEVGANGPVDLGQPVLSPASAEALAPAGLLGSDATPGDVGTARARFELGLLAGQRERLAEIIRATRAA